MFLLLLLSECMVGDIVCLGWGARFTRVCRRVCKFFLLLLDLRSEQLCATREAEVEKQVSRDVAENLQGS